MSTELAWSDVLEIGEGLRNRTLPAARFHHQQHCLATAYFLLTEPDTDWRSELPDLIRRYNVAMGGANTDSGGYHQTITLFYLDAIQDFLDEANGSPLERCRAMLASPLADKDYILRFYSRALLFSVEARRQFKKPDLTEAALRAREESGAR
jgi:hypothetical protein